MPPKKAGGKGQPAAKTQKVVEDKTFGMKNKKGAKAQKFIQTVQKQVQNTNAPRRAGPDQNELRQKKIEEDRKAQEELRTLFKPVVQTIAKGVDPKSVVCMYFKQGTCQKGDRCKFSHDLAVERKAEKRNIYEDTRENDNMADWNEDKLKDVVDQKHGEDNSKKKNTTEIVCKYFLEAVEKKTYGWFWNCPNGEKCMYRHALPPGFVLKSELKQMEDNKKNELSIEMLVEKERASLGKNVTKVTLESFLAWKKRKIIEKKEEKIIEENKKKANFKLGLHQGLSGRDLFTFNPNLIGDDDDGVDDGYDYKIRVDDDEETDGTQLVVKDINLDDFQATEDDGTGTTVTEDRFSYMDSIYKQEQDNKMAAGETIVEDVEDETAKNGDLPTTSNLNKPKIEIDESLFNADDLDGIDDELDDLELDED